MCASAVLAGCNGGGDGPSTTTTALRPGHVVEGGTMRLGLGAPVEPDPARANPGSPAAMMVLDLLSDGLTHLDGDGAAGPALATEWSSDPTLTKWVFHLNPAATFTSGRTVTAADVVASMERIARAGDASLAALLLEPVEGFRPFVAGSAEHLTGLTAPDAATVNIALDRPLSVLPVLLASPVFGIVDVASLDAARSDRTKLAHLALSGSWRLRTGTGPVLTLKRRDRSHGHLDAVELRSYTSPTRAYDAFAAGQVDWALVPPTRYAAAVREHGRDSFAPFHAELFFGMRVKGAHLGNVELRRAIAAAIDGDRIVRRVYRGLAQPLHTVVPGGVPGFDAKRCADCGHDPARAKAILAAAFPAGDVPLVSIDYDESPAQTAMAKLVAEDLTKVGVPTRLQAKPLEEYKAFVVSGDQELFSFGWIGTYRSPDAYLAPLFGSASNDNLTGYGAASVDAALAAARAASDPTEAAARWADVERQVLAEAVVVPIGQFRVQGVLSPRVHAFATRVDADVEWASVWLSDGG